MVAPTECMDSSRTSRGGGSDWSRGRPSVVERAGPHYRIRYGPLAFSGHAAAETNPDLEALIASVDSFWRSRNTGAVAGTAVFFRWCLANGLRIVQPMTLMSVGLYNEPAGGWLPSIIF